MEKIQREANSISTSIRATADYGSKYRDGKLPLLDVKSWIGRNKDGVIKIMHEHYMKDVSTRSLIHFNSAHPTNVKTNILVNEASRILRNCSKEMEWTDVVPHLNYFVKRMQFSGYPQDIRHTVIKRAIDKYDNTMQGREGNRRFVPSMETRRERIRNKAVKRRNWEKKEGKYEAVMFVEATKNSELKNRIRIAAKRNKVKIKIQERSGTKIKGLLQRSDPFSEKTCKRPTCIICTNEMGINCRTRGCVYQMMCKDCEDRADVRNKYRGQTSRSINERGGEHFDDWEKKKVDTPLWTHSREHHNGGTFPVEIKILNRCFGKPTRRKITEAVLIQAMKQEESMNNKNEYGFVRIPRVAVEVA